MLVFSTQTKVGAAQKLTVGSYRVIFDSQCLEEGLFYGDDLSKKDRKLLEQYVRTYRPDTVTEGVRKLRLLTRIEFLEEVYWNAYKARFLLVGFNLPSALSRIAFNFSSARDQFAGGFSLGLWSYTDNGGRNRIDTFRPKVRIKYIDNKRALIDFGGRRSPDKEDMIPEDPNSGDSKPARTFRGHFLDLRTFAFALTDNAYSLGEACEAFALEYRKHVRLRHGKVTEENIDQIRRDLLATTELSFKLLEEFNHHPLALSATRAFSPASIGKGYLRAMGIKPILARQPGFPKQYLGHAQTAFFGGRTSVHIRKVVCPVVYTDFLSMYSTVNSLMSLWQFVIAGEIRVVEHCQEEVETFLRQLKPDDLFKPEKWKNMAGFVQVVPDGDILPARSKFSSATNDWQVGINHLYAEPEHALWFAIPDVVASVLLTGQIPKITDAFRIEACGTLSNLCPTKLRGMVEVDPRSEDFFKVIVEERLRLSSRFDLPELERKRLEKALKVLASASSYGIYAQMDREDADDKFNVTCHGIDAEPYSCRVMHPDVPGEFCFPPLASLITAGARLMLSLLEHCVSELGGAYVMEDTDSMAIVATEGGGLVRCPGGPLGMKDGHSAVRALSWAQVEQIADRFATLNPYGSQARNHFSILKIERDNFNPVTGNQRQLYCLAISAKRYALFLLDEESTPVMLQKDVNNGEDRWSEHGLGHLRNPGDLESEDHDWIRQAWVSIVRRALHLRTQPLPFEDLPAVGRVTISSPVVMRSLSKLNFRKKRGDRLKPFDILLSCHVKQFGQPIGVDPERFHLVARYEPDPGKWLEMRWIDQHSGKSYRITTAGFHGERDVARVKTYGEILREYEFHPGSKSADPKGQPSGKQTLGLLQRRHVRVEQITYIGKESNNLEEVESGLIHSAQSVYTEYPDPRREEWHTKILPALKKFPVAALVKLSGLSRSTLTRALAGRSRPRLRNRNLLKTIIYRLGMI